MYKILLIAFKFPPFPGVGASRWSKLSKYLAKKGHEIYVLTVPWTISGSSSLIEDVIHQNIHVHRIKSGYIHNVYYKDFGNVLLNWLKVKILYLLNRFFYWDDEAQNWGRYLLPAAKKLIQENNIKVIVATGAPFEANYWAAMLKKEMQDIFLIQDFRDPWAQNPFKKYSLNRRVEVNKRMKISLEAANVSLAVTDGLREEYRKVSVDSDIRVLTNGYDPDIISSVLKLNKNKQSVNNKITFVHIGNISNGRDVPCKMFLDAIKSMSNISAQVQLIGYVPPTLKIQYQDMVRANKLVFIDTISQFEALRYVAQSNVALHFGAYEFPYLVSTKIYEYAGLQKPVLSLNFGGDIERMINDNHLGISVNMKKTSSIVPGILDVMEIENLYAFNIEQFSHVNLANQFIRTIDEIIGND